MNHIFSLATVFLLWLVVPEGSSSQSTEQRISDEEYSLYSALIDTGDLGNKPRQIVIVRATSSSILRSFTQEDQRDLEEKLSPLAPDTLDDYFDRNKKPRSLNNNFTVKAEVFLIDEKEINDIFRQQGVESGWGTFYKKYPNSGGFFRFSRVGFNSKKDETLVFVSHFCGGLCGTGTYYSLEKKGGSWKIKKEFLAWIS